MVNRSVSMNRSQVDSHSQNLRNLGWQQAILNPLYSSLTKPLFEEKFP